MLSEVVKVPRNGRLNWFKDATSPEHWHARFRDQVTVSLSKLEQYGPRVISILRSSLPRTGRILEAGCGTGWIVATLLRSGFEIEGIDYSEDLVQQVTAVRPDLPISFGDVCRLDVPDGFYRGYVSLGVIEHREEGPEPFLVEAYRVVASGGILCISVPHYNAIRRLKAAVGFYDDSPGGKPFYQWGITKPDFKELLTSHGFQVLGFKQYGTRRCFQEEFKRIDQTLANMPVLWRASRILDRLDGFGFGHMIMAVVRRP